jgi:hypothetical protein
MQTRPEYLLISTEYFLVSLISKLRRGGSKNVLAGGFSMKLADDSRAIADR